MVIIGVSTTYLYGFRLTSYSNEVFRPLFIGLPCALLVAALVAIERSGRLPNFAFVALAGDASYSLYLVHGFVLGLGQRLWHHFVTINSILSHMIFITLVLAVSIAAALIVYRQIELTFSRRLTVALKHFQSHSNAAPATRDAISN
jgi:exopolysaccharide production protein ExoZ